MYGWEGAYADKISKMRLDELKTLRRSVFLRSALGSMLSTAPSLVAALALASYAKLGNPLEPSKIFTALGLFSQMRFPLLIYPTLLNTLMEGKLSMERINAFLDIPEFQNYVVEETDPDVAVRIVNSTFRWTEGGEVSRSNDGRELYVPDLVIKKGEFVVIYGSVGSGKSMLVQAILGELIKKSGIVSRSGVVSYVPQSAWLPQDTVRNVILFGNPMRWHRYRSVLRACQLEKDLDRMDRGDRTDVGERGTGLSGGQRQRISLARAVYENADIYLLDDPLSAQDGEVGQTILRNCILTHLKDKTRIMVSNDLSILEVADKIILMGKNVSGPRNVVLQIATLDELLDLGYNLTDSDTHTESRNDSLIPKISNITAVDVVESPLEPSLPSIGVQALDPLTSSEALIMSDVALSSADVSTEDIEDESEAETALSEGIHLLDERPRGQLSKKVYMYYFNAMQLPAALLAAIIAVILANWSTVAQQWLVSRWTKDVHYEIQPLNMYLFELLRMGCAVGIFNWIRTYLFYELGLKASESIHSRLLNKVMSAPLSFVETTPLGRIVARFSKDLEHIDHQLPATISQLTASIVQTVAVMLSIAFVTPSFGALLIPIGTIYYFITRFYINVASDLKRLESFTRSPIVNHFGETLSGIPLIRSFGKQPDMIRRNDALLDENYAAGFATKVANRWVSFRLEMLGNLIVFFAASMAVAAHVGSNLAGISINNALTATGLLNWVIKNWADTESLMHSVDKEMAMIEKTEPEPMIVSKENDEHLTSPLFEIENITTTSGLIIPSIHSFVPNSESQSVDNSQNVTMSGFKHTKEDELLSSGWPWKGGIQFSNVTMRYAEGLKPVLKTVDFFVPGGSRIGIVGRSGSGKSSIFRALMRLTNIESGTIFIDGIDISKVDLKILRSQISVIPQDPVLFTGSIRSNIDPFERASDEELWDVLRKSHLSVFVASLPGGLDHLIEEGGSNLSLGQRQLFCLAR
jgi:ATP-binding cassette subfamily C (CFTR/MRP) protein 1